MHKKCHSIFSWGLWCPTSFLSKWSHKPECITWLWNEEKLRLRGIEKHITVVYALQITFQERSHFLLSNQWKGKITSEFSTLLINIVALRKLIRTKSKLLWGNKWEKQKDWKLNWIWPDVVEENKNPQFPQIYSQNIAQCISESWWFL